MYSTGHIDKKEMRDQPKPTTVEEMDIRFTETPYPTTGSSGGKFTAWDGSLTPPSATEPTTGERPPPLSVGWHKMKEQERATTGEWTEETVRMFGETCWNKESCKDVANAHNAALAAAIAAAQQPLVDALNDSQQMLMACADSAKILSRIDKSGGWTKGERTLVRVIAANSAALAKVKEGK